MAGSAGLLLELLQALAIEAELLTVLGQLAEQLTRAGHSDQAQAILTATTGLRDTLTAAYDRVLADTITPPAADPAGQED